MKAVSRKRGKYLPEDVSKNYPWEQALLAADTS